MWAIFAMKDPLSRLKLYIFQIKIWQKFTSQKYHRLYSTTVSILKRKGQKDFATTKIWQFPQIS
jgi:hypothetical protein